MTDELLKDAGYLNEDGTVNDRPVFMDKMLAEMNDNSFTRWQPARHVGSERERKNMIPQPLPPEPYQSNPDDSNGGEFGCALLFLGTMIFLAWVIITLTNAIVTALQVCR